MKLWFFFSVFSETLAFSTFLVQDDRDFLPLKIIYRFRRELRDLSRNIYQFSIINLRNLQRTAELKLLCPYISRIHYFILKYKLIRKN